MSAEERQARLLGEPSGESASIQTSGRVIRPALALPTALVNEGKLHITEDGLRVQAVDPANVGMIHMQIRPAAFDAYALDAEDELTIGCNLSGWAGKLRNARKGKRTDDPVALEIEDSRIVCEIEREYSQTTVRYADELLTIDPGSIREEPDLPDLELPATAAGVDVAALVDAIEHVNSSDDHVTARERDGDLLLTGRGEDDSTSPYGTAVEIEDVVECDDEADGPVAKYSIDYARDMAQALKTGLVDEVTFRWGNGFPFIMEFERTDGETTLYDGEFILAPRIGGED